MGSLQERAGRSLPEQGGVSGLSQVMFTHSRHPRAAGKQEERSTPVQAAGIAKGPILGCARWGPGEKEGIEPSAWSPGTRQTFSCPEGWGCDPTLTGMSQRRPWQGATVLPFTFPGRDKQRELLPPCAGGFPRSLVTCAALL